jgi:uncharacterized protein
MNTKKIAAAMLFVFGFLSSFAQIGKFTGSWQGTLNVGIELRVIFHITEDGKGGFITTADSPDQSAYGLKCDGTTVKDDNISIEMTSLSASFKGRLLNDTTIEGLFTQQGTIPLLLKKIEKIEKVVEKNRPQTPRPPFPYKSEEVEYGNADRSLVYGATITIPPGNGPFPAAVMITGSGPQDRDENILEHKLFAVIADHLTRKGFIVLRVDDRGVGKSTGNFSEATSEDFAKDVNSHIDYLLTRREVDKKKIGLIGHSEGGMIAPMVASKRKDIDFIVLLAGPGVKIIDLMAEQAAAIMRSSGINEQATIAYQPLYKEMLTQILHSTDTSNAITTVKKTMEAWAGKTDKYLIEELGMDKADGRSNIANSLVQSLYSPWFKYFFSFDPQPLLEQLNCKVLALNGDKDIQVISKQNLPGIEAALKKSKSKVFLVKELPGLNHLFQTCKKCNLNEYGELEETISPAALEIMSSWLEKNVK